MNIRIPDVNSEKKYIEDKHSIVLIGANGAGKTRMSIWINDNNPEINIHRISAQKSLNIPEYVSPTEISKAEEKFIYGTNTDNKKWLEREGKKHSRWGNDPETYLLNDVQPLMEYLMTDNFEKSNEYRSHHKNGDEGFDNDTKLEKIQAILEDIIQHRKLKITAGKIDVIDTDNDEDSCEYNLSKMSDGEREIFYFIGEVLCAKENSLIIIDEPESHLHKSILARLWDSIEDTRPDCTFLYITHDLDFASSRINSQIIWVKDFHAEKEWEYELLEEGHISDALSLEILGSRKKVLLVEGTENGSIDQKLYSKIFPEYCVIATGSCNAVIHTVKAYNNTSELHYIDVIGLVDRDRKSEEEIQKLARYNVYVPRVAEIENLFLLPEVISTVADAINLEEAQIKKLCLSAKEKTISFLKEQIENQVILFVNQKLKDTITQEINTCANNLEDLKKNIANIQKINLDKIYNDEKRVLQNIVIEEDFEGALKVINNKGLIQYTGIPAAFGWKKSGYIDFIIRTVGMDDNRGRQLKEIFKKYIVLP